MKRPVSKVGMMMSKMKLARLAEVSITTLTESSVARSAAEWKPGERFFSTRIHFGGQGEGLPLLRVSTICPLLDSIRYLHEGNFCPASCVSGAERVRAYVKFRNMQMVTILENFLAAFINREFRRQYFRKVYRCLPIR
jgi:hypothetical protein